ncbi:MAG TPA: hypothetical protein VG267_05345 [Terracidiphilus sp.]|jgi:hypothetical protein|nr:hypothetical protein [Terracidiphilus sp.]
MRLERRMILSLIASGRISAREAERLLAAWSEGREWFWIAVACAVLCAGQAFSHGLAPGIGHLVHALAPGWSSALHRASAEIVNGRGGL